mmetsp:Transcript_13938/g.33389  ORF Transcript_13938/g.33389 Transcript_13938/m.33389 type:complete len:252 (+) Transcript_13938:1485-2240(+)
MNPRHLSASTCRTKCPSSASTASDSAPDLEAAGHMASHMSVCASYAGWQAMAGGTLLDWDLATTTAAPVHTSRKIMPSQARARRSPALPPTTPRFSQITSVASGARVTHSRCVLRILRLSGRSIHANRLLGLNARSAFSRATSVSKVRNAEVVSPALVPIFCCNCASYFSMRLAWAWIAAFMTLLLPPLLANAASISVRRRSHLARCRCRPMRPPTSVPSTTMCTRPKRAKNCPISVGVMASRGNPSILSE